MQVFECNNLSNKGKKNMTKRKPTCPITAQDKGQQDLLWMSLQEHLKLANIQEAYTGRKKIYRPSRNLRAKTSILSNKDIKIVLVTILFAQESLKGNSFEKWKLIRLLITAVSWTIKEIHKITTYSGNDKYFRFLQKD